LQADKVYEIGNWEYLYLYREAPGALKYAALKFGAWMLELESRLRGVAAGNNQVSLERLHLYERRDWLTEWL
jgi:acid phosphatase